MLSRSALATNHMLQGSHAAKCNNRMPPNNRCPLTSRSAAAFQLILSVRIDFHTCCRVQSRTLSQKGNLPA